MKRPSRWNWLVPAVSVGGLLPAAVLAADAVRGLLGANPIRQATHQTGQLALILLLLSLACTPLRRLTHWPWPIRIRRALGLLAFFYAALHLGLYLLDQDLSLSQMAQDILKRPFVTAGFLALLLLLPLALTSTPRSVARLGFARWTRLHRLVYPAVGLATLHYWWGVKKDHTGPLIVVLGLIVLFAVRWLVPDKRKRKT
ncbi:sulfite oxidase heme-binding subunit YedZ [Deinococcus sp.]|uniref:sulfite oxidase heme-binding subunit YedZ n=1 Tax=Deinococcus sp. TaxID=47478 RepID=UPI0025C1530B|nr:protein-methionine-sulfoxide reductase heme-binding subunit MsrQ [Deinococcus sp.]